MVNVHAADAQSPANNVMQEDSHLGPAEGLVLTPGSSHVVVLFYGHSPSEYGAGLVEMRMMNIEFKCAFIHSNIINETDIVNHEPMLREFHPKMQQCKPRQTPQDRQENEHLITAK